jgi:hypothetical protein
MNDVHNEDGLERFRSYVEAKQRNIDWTDTLRNGSSVDALLWKGSAHLTGIQRAGIWIFGILFLFASLGLALIVWETHSGLAVLPVAFGLFISARLIRNACRRNSPPAQDEDS